MIIQDVFKSCTGAFFEDGYQTDWYPMDTHEVFKQNKKSKPQEMSMWHAKSISYKLNRYGFRTEYDFDNFKPAKNTWMVLGCSHSFGVGMPLKKTYLHHLEQHFGVRIVNLSVPGGSMDSCYRVCKAWYEIIKPDFVIIQKPDMSRRENLHNNEIISLGVWDKVYMKYRTMRQDDINDVFHETKVLDAIKGVIGDTKHFAFDWNIYPDEQIKDFARDQMHCGIKYNIDLYEHIVKNIKKII